MAKPTSGTPDSFNEVSSLADPKCGIANIAKVNNPAAIGTDNQVIKILYGVQFTQRANCKLGIVTFNFTSRQFHVLFS
jgi:hypothetical protein